MNLAAKQHQYWNDLSHPSMPDKHLVALEVRVIKKQLGPGRLLDVGCGEGENTRKFSQIKSLKPQGKLILCEGSLQGVKSPNNLRRKFKLEPISIRWHNVFIDDRKLIKEEFKLIDDFSGYFLFTRVARPFFDKDLNWDCTFNRLARDISLPIGCSRQKVWQFSNR